MYESDLCELVYVNNVSLNTSLRLFLLWYIVYMTKKSLEK